MKSKKKLIILGYDFDEDDKIFVSNDDHIRDSDLEADERFVIVPNLFRAPYGDDITDLIRASAKKIDIITRKDKIDKKILKDKQVFYDDNGGIFRDTSFSELEIALFSLQKNYGNTFLLEIIAKEHEDDLLLMYDEYCRDKFLEEGDNYLGLSYGVLSEDIIDSNIKVFSESWDAGFRSKWFGRIHMNGKKFPKKKNLSFLINENCEKANSFYLENTTDLEVFYNSEEVWKVVEGIHNLGYKNLNKYSDRSKKAKEEMAHNIFINLAIQMEYIFSGLDDEIDFAETLIPGEKDEGELYEIFLRKNQKIIH